LLSSAAAAVPQACQSSLNNAGLALVLQAVATGMLVTANMANEDYSGALADIIQVCKGGLPVRNVRSRTSAFMMCRGNRSQYWTFKFGVVLCAVVRLPISAQCQCTSKADSVNHVSGNYLRSCTVEFSASMAWCVWLCDVSAGS
jgi:hypothetical protein